MTAADYREIKNSLSQAIQRETAHLSRGMSLLATFSRLALLLGALGGVLRLIEMMAGLAKLSESNYMEAKTGQALLVAVTGLLIGFVLYMGHLSLSVMIGRLTRTHEKAANHLLQGLAEMEPEFQAATVAGRFEAKGLRRFKKVLQPYRRRINLLICFQIVILASFLVVVRAAADPPGWSRPNITTPLITTGDKIADVHYQPSLWISHEGVFRIGDTTGRILLIGREDLNERVAAMSGRGITRWLLFADHRLAYHVVEDLLADLRGNGAKKIVFMSRENPSLF